MAMKPISPSVKYRVDKCLRCIKEVSLLLSAGATPMWGTTPTLLPLFMAGKNSMEENRVQVVEMYNVLQKQSLLEVSDGSFLSTTDDRCC